MILFPGFKKYLSAAACFAVLLAGVFAVGNMTGFFQPDDPVVMNPVSGIVEVNSLEELSACVGFEVEGLNRLPFKVEETAYTAYWQEMAEIRYTGEGQTATFRKSVGTGDNSGDFTDYLVVKEITAGSLPITLKGDGEVYILAIWAEDGYACSVSLPAGISEVEWYDFVSG